MSLKITPLTGSIGARVEGIDLNGSVSDADFAVLHAAFLEHCVLVYRGQHLRPASQVEFARRWGKPVQDNPLLKGIAGHPDIIQVTKIPKINASTEAWHYDSPYTPVPPKISILAALTVPRGGDTMWCNQYNAYERLSPTMQKTIEGLRVKFVALRLGRMLGFAASDLPSAVHPLVRTHPETGRKALYVGHRETAQQIEGMTPEESRPLLDYLYQHSTSPDNFYRHMWEEGDVVMWDNRCTMHYAVHDYGEQERVLNRITMEGEVPR
ncbi:MAG TPA: TauD/TfdA family dioxygenase [Ramlibacter sp.]|nr:TauD/TfdA family dioxygenase [Ramlibacter sp.]